MFMVVHGPNVKHAELIVDIYYIGITGDGTQNHYVGHVENLSQNQK